MEVFHSIGSMHMRRIMVLICIFLVKSI